MKKEERGRGEKKKRENLDSVLSFWQIDNNCLIWFEMGMQGQREGREE